MPPDPSPPAPGLDPSRCKARSRRSGGQCRAYPVQGALVCSAHGGRAPQVKAAAGRRLAAAEWARSFGEPAATADPSGTVLAEIRWCAGHVAWLRGRVRAVDPEALVWGVDSEVDRRSGEWPGVDTTRAAKANAWLVLYGQERDRLVKMCEVAHRMGIEERQIRVAEEQGLAMAEAFRRVLDALGITEEQRARVPVLLRQAVAEVTSGEVSV